jgi:hypothetical protein
MYSEQSRKTTARVVFDVVDPSAKPVASSTSTNQADISKVLQTINTNKNSSNLFLSTKLFGDGFIIPPTENEIANDDVEVGYISDSISDVNGDFTVNPIIEFNVPILVNSIGFSMNFNEFNYPQTIIISAYQDTTLLDSETLSVTDANVFWDNPLSDYNKIEIEFVKTNKAYSRAQLIEVYFGAIQTFNRDKIISLKLDETMNTTNETIEQNQMVLTVEDKEKLFNILNPTGLYSYLLERQPFTLELGVEVATDTFEYTDMGRFFLKEWNVDNNQVEFTTRDILFFRKHRLDTSSMQ